MEPAVVAVCLSGNTPKYGGNVLFQSLEWMTGGRGEYTMAFLRYEEVPAHVASGLVESSAAKGELARA